MRIRDWLLVVATVAALFALCFLAGRFIPTAEASGGTLRYRYADEGELHPWALTVIQSAMHEWETVCGIRFERSADLKATRISWPGDLPEYIGAWTLEDEGILAIEFNTEALRDLATLYHVARHEIGHAIGLPHSNVPNSVMSGPPFTQYAIFTPRLQLSDIESCRALYGAS